MSDVMLENPINEDIVSSENTVSDVVNESGLSTYIIFGLIVGGCYGLYYYYYGRVISKLKFKIDQFDICVCKAFVGEESYDITIFKEFDKLYDFEIESKDLYNLMSTGKSDEAIEFSKNLINVNVSNAMKKLICVFDGDYLEYNDRNIQLSNYNKIYIDVDYKSKKISKHSLMNIVNKVNKFFEVYEDLDCIWNDDCKSVYNEASQKMNSFVKVKEWGDNVKCYEFEQYIFLTYLLSDEEYTYWFNKASMDENGKHGMSPSNSTIENLISDFCISKYNEILNFIKNDKNIDLDEDISGFVFNMSYFIGDSNLKTHSIKSNFYFNDFKFDVKKFLDDIRKMIKYFDIFKDHNLLNQQAIDKFDDLLRMCDEYDDHINELEYKDQKVCLYEYKIGDVTKCEIYALGKSDRIVISRGKYNSIDKFKENSGKELLMFIAGNFCKSVLSFDCDKIAKNCDITGLYDDQLIRKKVSEDLSAEKARKNYDVRLVAESILVCFGMSKLFGDISQFIQKISGACSVFGKIIYRSALVYVNADDYTTILSVLWYCIRELYCRYEELKNIKPKSFDPESFETKSPDEYDKMLDEWIEDIDYDGLPLVVDDISSINSDDVDSVDYDSYYDE